MVAGTLVLAALAYATVEQGAWYRGPFLVVLVLVVAAVLATGRAGLRLVGPLAAVLGLALAVEVALTRATWSSVAPTVGVLLVGLAALAVAATVDRDDGDRLVLGVLAVAALASLAAWYGVAAHHEPWASTTSGLWRGASTVTYANATAALAAVGLVLGLDRLRRSPEALTWLASAACLLGLLTTASRAGLLGAAVGLAWLAHRTGGRATGRRVAGLAGPVVVMALGLLPSVPARSDAHLALAVVTLVAGAAGGLALQRGDRRAVGVLAGAAVVALVALPVLGSGSWAAARDTRLSLDSPQRADVWSAAVDEIVDRPWLGAGAGHLDLRPTSASLVHNEYLELLATHGLLGVAALVACALLLRRRWSGRAEPAAVAALLGLAVHSAFDFTGHVPLLVLVAGVLIGRCVAVPADVPQREEALARA